MQNNLARVVCNSSRLLTQAEPLLLSLHWLPVRQRSNYKLANFCYLAVSRHQPVYLAHLIRPYSQSRLLRSSTQSLLSVPRTTSTLLLVVSLSRHQDSGTLFHWAVGLLHPLTFSRTDLRHSFSVCDSDIVARASVLWRVINWMIWFDWLIDWLKHVNDKNLGNQS